MSLVSTKYQNSNTMSKKANEIIEFVHANSVRVNGEIVPDGPHIGCVLAKTTRIRRGDGTFGSAITIGWSQVNRNAGDKFNRTEAIRVARRRANSVSYDAPPRKAKKIYMKMVGRANRYFKNLQWA